MPFSPTKAIIAGMTNLLAICAFIDLCVYTYGALVNHVGKGVNFILTIIPTTLLRHLSCNLASID